MARFSLFNARAVPVLIVGRPSWPPLPQVAAKIAALHLASQRDVKRLALLRGRVPALGMTKKENTLARQRRRAGASSGMEPARPRAGVSPNGLRAGRLQRDGVARRRCHGIMSCRARDRTREGGFIVIPSAVEESLTISPRATGSAGIKEREQRTSRRPLRTSIALKALRVRGAWTKGSPL